MMASGRAPGAGAAKEMLRNPRTWLLAALVFMLTHSTSHAQLWASPTLVAQGFYQTEYEGAAQLVRTPGDTFWALVFAEDSAFTQPRLTAYWSAGDSWRGPTALWTDSGYGMVGTGHASVDPGGRIWFGWGTAVPDPWYPFYWSGTNWYVIHDSSGWRSPDSARYDLNVLPTGVGFAADRGEQWFMAYSEVVGFGTTGSEVAMYQKWLGTSWDSVVGLGSSGLMEYYEDPLLTPDPVAGFWAVLHYGRFGISELQVYRLPGSPDIPRFVLPVQPGQPFTIATDSAGGVWLTYLDSTRLRWILIEQEQLVDSGVLHSPAAGGVLAGVDPAGVVWAVWTQDSTIWASYNRGVGWTEPELVVDSISSLDCVTFDRDGLPEIAFQRASSFVSPHQLYVTHRLSHVAKAEDRPERASPRQSQLRCEPNPFVSFAVISGHESEEFTVFDATGTAACLCRGSDIGADLGPGVYFIRSKDSSFPALRVLKIR